MMSYFFCAEMSRNLGENLIGTAPTRSMYVLIECPHPWSANDFESKAVPANLRSLVEKIRAARFPIRFLLFTGTQPDRTRIMVFRTSAGLIQRYLKREFEVETIEQAAPLLEQFLTGQGLDIDCQESATQDIFVCTHGSHDKCCAKFGFPFYRQVSEIVAQLGLDHLRIWQVSHLGGHRFAPTIVTFPDGRYYGTLDEKTFMAILQRLGDVQCLQRVYRGWGLLPKPIQAIERELALQHGWEWFSYGVVYRILNTDANTKAMSVELRCEKPGAISWLYTATTIEVETQDVIGSCSHPHLSKTTKFAVEDLQLQRTYWTDSFSKSRLGFLPAHDLGTAAIVR